MTVRVFHGDDSDSYRHLIRAVLPQQGGIEVVGGAGEPADLVAGVEREQPDVVLLDQLKEPGLLGRLRDVAPGVRIVVLSGWEPGFGDPELERDCDAYVVKTADLAEVAAAVRGG